MKNMTGNCNTQGRTNLILVEDKNNRKYRWVTMQEKVQYAPIKLFKSLTPIFEIDDNDFDIDWAIEILFEEEPEESIHTLMLPNDIISKLDISSYLQTSYLLRKSKYIFNKKTQTLKTK